MTISTRRGRSTVIVAVVLGAVLALTGCSSSDTPEDDNGASSEPTSSFPVTIDSADGEVTVSKTPERIVALDVQTAEYLAELGAPVIAFGVDGIAIDEWSERRPWMPDLAGEADISIVSYDNGGDGVNAEAVATWEPDLIVGSWLSVGTEQQYEQLSSIAPTYVGEQQGKEDPWRDRLENLGALTGTQDRAEKVTNELESRMEAWRDKLPGLQGKTVISALYWEGSIRVAEGGGIYEDLGLIPAVSEATELSMENLDRLDSDVLSLQIFGSDDGLFEDPRVAELPASKNKALIQIPDDSQLLNATSQPSPQALEWLIDTLGPQLEDSSLNH